MNILIAPDKFKGSLSAQEVANAIAKGLGAKFHTTQLPMADGGDGTLDILIHHTHGHLVQAQVHDPLFRPIQAAYGITGDGKTAIIEMARASGLELLRPNERNPLFTSSYGTGQLISDAIDHGVDEIVLAIGGSATNDAGLGMAAALGFQFEDVSGNSLHPSGQNLVKLNAIKTDKVNSGISRTKFVVLCDVDNPLYGEQGAARVFGPQKGADEQAIRQLDHGLRQVEMIVFAELGKRLDFPGAGAAGGLGAGASAFLNAVVEPGFDYIARRTGLDDAIQFADAVITGEGRLDTQTLSGKVVAGITRKCKTAGKACIAVVGQNTLNGDGLARLGLSQVFALVSQGISPETAMANTQNVLSGVIMQQVIPWLERK
ncbi:MAG TPA: glycerate kinase [Cyclobacteriaceae bacterium]|nr:glycerate kinase [Cyclobacteriaceae bacterium]